VLQSRNPVIKTVFSNDIFMIYQPIHMSLFGNGENEFLYHKC